MDFFYGDTDNMDFIHMVVMVLYRKWQDIIAIKINIFAVKLKAYNKKQ